MMRDTGINETGTRAIMPGVSVSEGGEHHETRDKFESQFKASAPRSSYSGQGRADVQLAGDFQVNVQTRRARLERFLKDNGRVVAEHKHPKFPKQVSVWLATDFAWCKRARGSTSGG